MQRWPLHPQPYLYETLGRYVSRLAECYGVSYLCFCRNALGMSATEIREYRWFNDKPTPHILEHLSSGTGVSIEELTLMMPDKIWARLMDELKNSTLSSD